MTRIPFHILLSSTKESMFPFEYRHLHPLERSAANEEANHPVFLIPTVTEQMPSYNFSGDPSCSIANGSPASPSWGLVLITLHTSSVPKRSHNFLNYFVIISVVNFSCWQCKYSQRPFKESKWKSVFYEVLAIKKRLLFMVLGSIRVRGHLSIQLKIF